MITLEELSHICSILNECKVKYIIIGGCAVILHGLERTTMDIDLLIEKNTQNINNLKRVLSRFLEEKEIEEINTEMLEEYKVIRIGLKDFYIDIITEANEITYEKIKNDILYENVINTIIPFAGLDSMLKLKQTFREIDQKDTLFLFGKKLFINKDKK
ncbi:MAG: nucleotidyl transferase AbiEii/AbiGii toxin family protein [Bacteroidia bacterium]|nr:nucleotidyl transferase AbiEii/AbiGii toxin family protein [Bacteroidia bacterium]